MKKIILLFAILSANLTWADSFEEDAKKVLMPFKKNLMGKLTEGMKKGSVNAFNTCNLLAPGITKSAATKKFTVGRTSMRYRNPKNAPQIWMDAILADYTKSDAKNVMAPRVIKLENGHQAYVEPIYVKEMCLNCHGANIKMEIKELLNTHYPQDRAKNYKEGEFRGLFWVTEN